MKKLLIVLACLLFITGCKDVKLENGDNAIVTFKEGGISAKDLYEELKSSHGGESVTNLIDMYLLEKKYPTDDEEKEYVKDALKNVKKNAKSSGTTVNNFLSMYYGIANEEAFEKSMTLNYKRNKFVEDYAKEHVTEKQIKEYYDQKIYGDVEASQILITIDANDDATDEEKQAAENKALETANTVIESLKGGTDFAELAKKYSKDQTSSSNGGSLGKVNDGDLPDEALEALRKLKDGTYTTEAIKSSEGYHILFRTSMSDKPKIEDVKDKITEKVGAEMAKESGYSATALKALREENEMKFVDTNLEKQFESLN